MKGAVLTGLACILALPLLILAVAPSNSDAGACGVTSASGPTAGPWDGMDTEAIQNTMLAAAVVKARAWSAADTYAAILILAATGRQESGMHNLGHGDTAGPDSRGVLQQRDSWGPIADRLNPIKAFGLFLDRLTNLAGWQGMTPEHAAHLIQGNANEGDYTKWVPWAAKVAAVFTASGSGGYAVTCGPAASSPGGTGNNVAGQTTVPPGLVLTGTVLGNRAVAYAAQQLGKPYVWAASGPDAFDCSGLTMAAWGSVGIPLPHFTVTQAAAGIAEPANLSTAVSGDLVFIPGSDGTAAAPGHVGIVAGYTTVNTARHIWIIQAPMTGIPVEFTDSSEWAGQITAVRHIG